MCDFWYWSTAVLITNTFEQFKVEVFPRVRHASISYSISNLSWLTVASPAGFLERKRGPFPAAKQMCKLLVTWSQRRRVTVKTCTTEARGGAQGHKLILCAQDLNWFATEKLVSEFRCMPCCKSVPAWLLTKVKGRLISVSPGQKGRVSFWFCCSMNACIYIQCINIYSFAPITTACGSVSFDWLM